MDYLTPLCSTNSMCCSSAPVPVTEKCASQMDCSRDFVTSTVENKMATVVACVEHSAIQRDYGLNLGEN